MSISIYLHSSEALLSDLNQNTLHQGCTILAEKGTHQNQADALT